MLQKLILATGNAGKTREISECLKGLPVEVASMSIDPKCPESPEPFETYIENARDKARLVAQHFGTWALADDSGLEITALGGKPGVYSARYAGEGATYEDNWQKVLVEMKDVPYKKRGAAFRCCMVLTHPDGQEFISEGVLPGQITTAPKGEGGFGYDPIFYLPEQRKTLAELDFAAKNEISHRRRALNGMLTHLRAVFT